MTNSGKNRLQYGPIGQCQVCESTDLRCVLFLGYLPPVNQLRPIGSKATAEQRYPAELLYCPVCHLVQLGYAVDPSTLFPPEYPYLSSATRILRDNFSDLYREATTQANLSTDDLIVDIGSNDGSLLSNFLAGGYRVLGIEPTLAAEIAHANGIPTLMAFFNEESVARVKKEHGAPKLITAANVFAHIHGVHRTVDLIAELLDETGVFVSESHYLRDLVETLQYDAIYHEHLRYYSLTSLQYLLGAHGFRIFHAKRIPTHGGSIRVYASKSGSHPVDPSVESLLREEVVAGIVGDAWIGEFRERVVRSKLQFYQLVSRLGGGGLYGIGAPSRASTFINYVGLDSALLNCVLETKMSKKVGQYVPGTDIPILDEEKLYIDQPPFVLLLSWHITGELCRNLKRRGYRGDFIVPLPEPRIVHGNGPEPE